MSDAATLRLIIAIGVVVGLLVWPMVIILRNDAKRTASRKAAGVVHRYWPHYEAAVIAIAAQLAASGNAGEQQEPLAPADIAKRAFDYADALALESAARKPREQ